MDLEDEEWVNIPYDGLLEVHNDGDEKIFSRKYVKSPSNFLKSNYFNTKQNLHHNFVEDEPIFEKQMVSCTSRLDHKDEVKVPNLINESKESSHDPKLDQDPIFQVVFKKENKFVEMKLDSRELSPQESNLSHIETGAFQYEENSGDHIVNCSSPSKTIKQEAVAWEESNKKLNFWKWGLSGIGAFCSVGMAAATICIIIFGNGRKHKQQKLTIQIYPENKEKAARLPPIEEVKTLLNYSIRGVLSTFSQKHDGYPSGSMVDFACDANGSPILAVSSLAVHSKDLLANPKCSLLVAKDPEDRTDLIITVHGDAVPVPNVDRDVIRTAYLAKHPDAFWVDFGDFQFLRIEPKVVRFVSGVATALLGSGEFTKEEFAAAKVDPIYQFSKPVTSHMNKDHSDDTKLMVQHSTSILVDFAYMLDLDSLGFNVKAGYQGRNFKLRIPFPRRAENRKDVKTLIVEMLQAARSPVS